MNKSSVAPSPPVLRRRATIKPLLNWPTTSIKPKSALESTRESVAVAFSSSAPRSEDRVAGCGGCKVDLRLRYADHALVVRSRSNVSGGAYPTIVRTTSVRTRSLGSGGRAAATTLLGVLSEDESNGSSSLDVKSSSGFGGLVEIAVAAVRETSLWGFMDSSSLSEESTTMIVSSTTSVDDRPSLLISGLSASLTVFFGLELRLSSAAVCSTSSSSSGLSLSPSFSLSRTTWAPSRANPASCARMLTLALLPVLTSPGCGRLRGGPSWPGFRFQEAPDVSSTNCTGPRVLLVFSERICSTRAGVRPGPAKRWVEVGSTGAGAGGEGRVFFGGFSSSSEMGSSDAGRARF